MNEFQIMAAKTALKNMFENKSYFNICTVKKVMKITGCIPDRKDMQALEALHCVDWIDMDAELRSMVMLKTARIFEQPGFDMGVLEDVFKSNSKLLLN